MTILETFIRLRNDLKVWVTNNLNQKANITTLDNYYLKSEADTLHTEVLEYVDTEVAALVNSAPETLDTLGELAAAFEENQDMVATLDAAITMKANTSDLESIQEDISSLQSQVLLDSFIIQDKITGDLYKIQIQNGQLVTFSLKEGV